MKKTGKSAADPQDLSCELCIECNECESIGTGGPLLGIVAMLLENVPMLHTGAGM